MSQVPAEATAITTFTQGYRLCSADRALQKLAPVSCSKSKYLTRSHLVFNSRSVPNSVPFFRQVSAAISDAGRDILRGLTPANKSSFPQLCNLNIMKTFLSLVSRFAFLSPSLVKSIVTQWIKILKSSPQQHLTTRGKFSPRSSSSSGLWKMWYSKETL